MNELGKCRCLASLCELNRHLALRLGHFAPQLLQFSLRDLVIRFFVEGHGIPAIGGRQVARHAGSIGIKRTHLHRRLGFALVDRGFQNSQAAVAVLADSPPVEIFF